MAVRSGTPTWCGPGSGPVDAEGLAVWAFKVHKAGILPSTVVWGGGGVTSTAVVGSNAALGATVDTSRYRRYPLPDLAMDVDTAVSRIGGLAAQLIRRYCGRGDRPDWGRDMRTRFEPKWKMFEARDPATGAPVPGSVETFRLYDKHRNLVTSYCPVILLDPPELIEAKRTEYEIWWSALELLGYAMCRKVPEMIALRAPRKPWLQNPLASYEKV